MDKKSSYDKGLQQIRINGKRKSRGKGNKLRWKHIEPDAKQNVGVGTTYIEVNKVRCGDETYQTKSSLQRIDTKGFNRLRRCGHGSKLKNIQYRKSRKQKLNKIFNPLSSNPLNLDFINKKVMKRKIREIICSDLCNIPNYLLKGYGRQYQRDISYHRPESIFLANGGTFVGDEDIRKAD